MKTRIWTIALLACWAIAVCNAEDELQYAISLEQAGYHWLALEEYDLLESRLTGAQKQLLPLRRARIFDRLGHEAGAVQARERFLEIAHKPASALVAQAVEEARTDLIEINDRKASDLIVKGRKEGFSPEIRSELNAYCEALIPYREKRLASFSHYNQNNPAHCSRYYSMMVDCARAYYYEACAAEAEEAVSKLEKLETGYLNTLQASAFEKTLEFTLLQGWTAIGLDKHEDAIRVFIRAVDYPDIPANRAMLAEAWYGAVESAFAAGEYRRSAETGITYLLENSRMQAAAPVYDQLLRSRVVSSIQRITKPGEQPFISLRRQGGRSYAVLGVRAGRTALSQAPPRTFTVTGGGATQSSAVIEMPGVNVQQANSTVAVPAQ